MKAHKIDREKGRIKLVIIFQGVVSRMFRHIIRGVKRGRKVEKMGILLGREERRGRVLIIKTFPYRGGERRSTGCEYDPDLLLERIRTLEERTGLEYIGLYHSHVERGGKFYFGVSPADKMEFLEDEDSIVEIVGGIRRCEDPLPIPSGGKRLFREKEGYRLIMTAYSKGEGLVYQVPLREAIFVRK